MQLTVQNPAFEGKLLGSRKSCVQPPFINQSVGNSVLEGAACPGSRTASSILAAVTNFYTHLLRKNALNKRGWQCHYWLKVGSALHTE